MSATCVMRELDRLGIRLTANGNRLRFCPQSAVTPDLLAGLKAHKLELLAALEAEQEAAAAEVLEERQSIQAVEREAERDHAAHAAWQQLLETLKDDPEFPLDILNALRTTEVRWSGPRESELR